MHRSLILGAIGIAGVFMLEDLMAAKTDSVTVPIPSIPSSVEMAVLPTLYAGQVASLVTEGLFGTGDGFEIQPVVAESSKWSDDRKTLLIKLRKKSFGDGTPVTPKDVIGSLKNCVLASRTSHISAFQLIEGYKELSTGKTDKLTGLLEVPSNELAVRLTAPAPLLLDELTQRNCSILKPDPSGGTDLLKGAQGTGPYRLLKAEKNSISFELRDASLKVPKQVTFKRFEGEETFDKMSGWADVMILPEAPTKHPEFNRYDCWDRFSQQLIFNNSSSPFNNKEARKAVASAINYKRLQAALGWPDSHLQEGLIPFGMRGFRQRKSLKPETSRTNSVLGKLGYSARKPLVFEILVRDTPEGRREAAVWESMFEGAWLSPKVVILPLDELFKRTKEGAFQAARIGKDPASTEPYRLFSSYTSESAWNNAHVRLKTYDMLIDRTFEEANSDRRYKLYGEADRYLVDEEAALVPLATVKPKTVLVRKPWGLRRKNRYLVYPHRTYEWEVVGN